MSDFTLHLNLEEYEEYYQKILVARNEKNKQAAGLNFVGVYIDVEDIRYLEVGHKASDISFGEVSMLDRSNGMFQVTKGAHEKLRAEDYERAGNILLQHAKSLRDK